MYTLRVDCTPSLHTVVYDLTKEVSAFVHRVVVKLSKHLTDWKIYIFLPSESLLKLWGLIVGTSTIKQHISLEIVSIYFRDLNSSVVLECKKELNRTDPITCSLFFFLSFFIYTRR